MWPGLRFRWLEGKIQQSLGLVDDAEQSLLEARRGFVERGLGFDAAGVSLDLAGLYAAQDRAAEMHRVEMIALADNFAAWVPQASAVI